MEDMLVKSSSFLSCAWIPPHFTVLLGFSDLTGSNLCWAPLAANRKRVSFTRFLDDVFPRAIGVSEALLWD